MEIKYTTIIPPVYNRCKKTFGINWNKGIVITYGNLVCSKFGDELTGDLKAHEQTHVKQQTSLGKELWWDKYFADKDFRLSQEVEAYRNQMEYAKKHYPKDHYEWLFDRLTSDMANIYGKMCTKEEAIKLLS